MLSAFEFCEKRTYLVNPAAARRTEDYQYAKSRVRRPNQGRNPERGYEIASHFAEVIATRRRVETPELSREFQDCAKRWRQETRILSSIQAKIFNSHYQRIIGMGRAALPLIFADLKEIGGHWYWALECICGENPASGAETLPEAKRLWLEYANKHNLV